MGEGMNKVFCNVWSPVLKQLVVASELASCKSQGGRGPRVVARSNGRMQPIASSVLLALAGLSLGGGAAAQTVVDCSASPFNQYSGYSTCVGYLSKAGAGSTALGAGSVAENDGALAVGLLARAFQPHATAIGWQAYADGINAIYLGARTIGGATAESAIAIGTDVTASGAFTIGMGLQARATQQGAVSVGMWSRSTGLSSIAIGGDSVAGANAGADNAIAIGARASTTGVNAAALGYDARATSTNSTAVGALSQSTGAFATALGAGGSDAASSVRASGAGAFAAGGNATAGANASGDNALALGGQSNATQANAVAIGLLSNAAASNAVAVGHGSQALAASTVAFGDGNVVSASAGVGSIAGGYNSRVLAGAGAVALGEGQTASGDGAVAIGDPNTATGTGAVAVGADNTATGDGAVALGNQNNAQGAGSVALGNASTAAAAGSLAFGSGATASNAGDVALGSGTTTAAAVGTADAVINGATYSFAGTAPSSTVSIGRAGAERTLTNLAAGRITQNSTDAINGSQLFATHQAIETLSNTVSANTTHYYSVNDGGTAGGNHANDGAGGLNAVAAGVGASASGVATVALGNAAVAQGDDSMALGAGARVSTPAGVALGSGAVSDRVLAPSSGSILVGTNVVPYNTTDRTLLGAVSVGDAGSFRQITNVADGTEDQDAVTLRQLKGAMSSFSVTPIQYFHANSTASDSAAIGAESVAIGPQTTVNGDNGIGLGNGAIVQQTAPGGTAIGQGATVDLADGIALGTHAASRGIQALALGAGAQAEYAASVALGAGAVTAAPVATTNVTLNGTTYTFAGTAPGSTVSIGAAAAERTLTNLAAGRIDSLSTDAINGSQLYATNQSLEQLGQQLINLSQTVNNGPNNGGTTLITYQTSADNTAAAAATGSNATAAGAGAVASGSNSTALGANTVASGNNSVALGAGSVASGANTVSVGSAGHERTISNVAAGVNRTDAVNVGQLNEAVVGLQDWVRGYNDEWRQTMDRRVSRMGDRANAGIASAMAMASLPQAYQPNQSSAGVALGAFQGEASIAVGLSTITESGRYIFKASATANSRGDAGAGIGAGVVW